MMNNPDMQPNVAMNHWITAIWLFNFKLVHVPAEKHLGADGLSCHEPVPSEDNEDDDPEEWVDNVLSLGIWVDSQQHTRPTTKNFEVLVEEPSPLVMTDSTSQNLTPSTRDEELKQICRFLTNTIQGGLLLCHGRDNSPDLGKGH